MNNSFAGIVGPESEKFNSFSGISLSSRITSAISTSATPVNHYGDGSAIKVSTGSSLNSIASSPSGEMVVVGGREILKVFSTTGMDSQEVLNLRMGAKSSLNLNSNDVAWGHGSYKSTVVSASTSGAIVVYDLNKPEKIDRILSEHLRSVHSVNFHPTEPALLLSASQDGSMKLWDFRAGNSSKQTFDGKAEGARESQFNPVTLFEFASVFDNGCLQLRDLRNPSQCERKWSAHNGLALAVGWNASGTLLGTGGRDKVIKVWDAKSELRKPMCSIQTIASVSCLRWRPGHDSQIAACSLSHDFRVHIWDYTKPFLPLLCLDNHENVATGIVWRGSDTLLSCSKDETFVINGISGAYSPSSFLNSNISAWSPYGDVAFASKARLPSEVKSGSEIYTSNKQVMGSFLFDSLDYSSFAFLAHYYEVDPSNISKTCDTNADLAKTVGLPEIEHTWKLIKLLFGVSEFSSMGPRNLTTLFKKHQFDSYSSSKKKIFSFFKDIFSGGIKTDEQNLPFPAIAESSAGINGPDLFSNESSSENSLSDEEDEHLLKKENPIFAPLKPNIREANGILKKAPQVTESAWDPERVVVNLLDYYSELGNPQMTTLISMLLGERVKLDALAVELYTRSYLDLMRRLELWPEAVKLINISNIDSISQLNAEATTLHRSCYNCTNPISLISKTPSHCENCKKPISMCCLCHKRVDGLYSWCQWCSHGGHLNCMDEWFADNDDCPSGCGHVCFR